MMWSLPTAHQQGMGYGKRDLGTKVQPLLAEKNQCYHRRSSTGMEAVGGCGPFCTTASLDRSPQVTCHSVNRLQGALSFSHSKNQGVGNGGLVQHFHDASRH